MATQFKLSTFLGSATALACLVMVGSLSQRPTVRAQEQLPPIPTTPSDTPLNAPGLGAPESGSPSFETPSNLPTIPRLDVQTKASEGRYRLGPGDVVGIEIFNVPEFSGQQQILTDGTITLSLLGSLSVQGLTLREASDLLTTQFSEFLNSPIVNVTLVSARPPRVAVLGEVETPGPHVYGSQPDETLSAVVAPTVVELIQTAGGITTQADIRNVQVRRPSVDGPDEIIDVDLWTLMTGDGVAADPVVFDGDTIFVPTASIDLPDNETFLLSASNLSPETIDIIIVGEVITPGPITVPSNTPLHQALFLGGDFLRPRANTNQIGLVRLNPDGTVKRTQVPIDIAANVNDESNPTLQDNDIIIVGKSGLATFTDGLTTVVSPLEPIVPVFGIINTIDRVFFDR